MNWPILSIVVWLPIFGGIAVMLLGAQRAQVGKQLALGVSIVTFALSLPLWTGFDSGSAAMQFVESIPWIERFDANYALGVDGISMPLILLTTFLTPFVVVAGWQVIETRPSQYFAAFLILEGLLVGTFAATDALLFYVFWEAMLVPMFIIIGVWGGARRVFATV
jgi:NADH-quinone oxidoreductase subunit M